MRGCQLALAEAYIPAYLSLLPILSSSCLGFCFLWPQKMSQIPDPKMGSQLKLSKFAALFWAHGLGAGLSAKRALNCATSFIVRQCFLAFGCHMLASQWGDTAKKAEIGLKTRLHFKEPKTNRQKLLKELELRLNSLHPRHQS